MLIKCFSNLPALLMFCFISTAHGHGGHHHHHESETKVSERIAALLRSSETAGHSHAHYEQAGELLKTALKSEPDNSHLWYQWARVLQHDHQFDSALQATDKALSLNPHNAAALLLKSALHLTLAQYSEAKRSCASLLGKTSALMVAACSAEVSSYIDEPEKAWQQLTMAMKKFDLPDGISGQWVVQIAAELAYRTNRYPEAARLLSRFELDSVPVSYLLLWSDVHLAMQQPDSVISEIGKVVKTHEFIADALLLRLALAEQNSSQSHWTRQLHSIMQERISQHDTHHAGEVARYLLYFKDQPEDASFWANINWQQSKLAQDKALLELAQQY